MDHENPPLTVEPASPGDLDAVMHLFCGARKWHEREGLDVWSKFDPEQVARDIAAGRVFVTRAAGGILGTVTLAESDPLVWGADERKAMYVHRLASSRETAGRGIGARMLQWARRFARERGKECLRLDTWDGNRKMRKYYERLGFRHIEDKFFPLDSPFPADYRGTFKSLYELELVSSDGKD